RVGIRIPVDAALLEVRRLDDERVAFPMSTGIAHIEVDVAADVRAPRNGIERDDARLVHHLVANRDVTGALDDLIRVAVDRRHHRAGYAARDAAVVEVAILEGISRAAAAVAARGGNRGDALLAFARHDRDVAVRRIDDQPRLAAPAKIESVLPPVVWRVNRPLEVV